MWNGGSDNNEDALKIGWKKNNSMICYYERDYEKYRVFDGDYLKNRVFLTRDIYHNIRDKKFTEFNSICDNGIFYCKLAELLVNEKNLDAEKNSEDLTQILLQRHG